MSATVTVQEREAKLPELASSKFEREMAAFYRLLPDLLATHRGRHVAVHDEQVVDVGDDPLALANRVWDRVGYVAIYVGHVSVEPPAPLRVGALRDYGSRRGHA